MRISLFQVQNLQHLRIKRLGICLLAIRIDSCISFAFSNFMSHFSDNFSSTLGAKQPSSGKFQFVNTAQANSWVWSQMLSAICYCVQVHWWLVFVRALCTENKNLLILQLNVKCLTIPLHSQLDWSSSLCAGLSSWMSWDLKCSCTLSYHGFNTPQRNVHFRFCMLCAKEREVVEPLETKRPL